MSSERNVLPVDPKPQHYDLTIKPNFSDFTFEGAVTITLQAEKPTTSITFNTIELSFDTVSVSNGETFKGSDLQLDTHLERGTVTLAKPVGPGDFTMSFVYTGIMNDKMKGFYRSKYTLNGEETYMGTTQFEAVDCRRALPCWDEPVHKATFDVTLVVPKTLNALSNMPEKSRSEDGELATVTFDTSPKMSTYLLAWTIAKFDCIQRTIKKSRGGETLVRVFATEGKIAQGEFALDVACKCLPLYEEFFGSDYILPKCDLLAIPDFAAGAMENWGLITYRETCLLCDEKSAKAQTEYVAIVVAHELAHQWFGNLVTMDWWKELWLNESFATWCQYWATDLLFPEWDVFSRFVCQSTKSALDLDALKTSHPVEVKVLKNAHEVDEIFDAISYCKGGSILRQTVDFIGIDAFKAGVQEYLEKFKFANATTQDLWFYLGKAAGKDLTQMLDPWILEQGYPMLRVRKGTAAPDTLVVSQERYLSTGKATEEENSTVWEVPLNLRSAGADATETRVVLNEKESTIEYKNASSVKVNSRQFAFCRIQYEAELLPPLMEAIQKKTIGNLDRLGLISDYTAFATSGHGTAVEALAMAKNYQGEDDFNVWSAVNALVGEVKAMLRVASSETVAKFEAWVHELYKPAFDKVGAAPKEGEDSKLTQLRTILLGRLAGCNYPAALEACQAMWDNRATKEIPADLRGAVYTGQVRTKGAEGVAAMKQHYADATDAMERARALMAMGACSDVAMLENELFPFALSDKVRSMDAAYFIRSAGANPAAEDLYVKVFTQQWRQVYDKFPGMVLTGFVSTIKNFYKAESATALKAFWAAGMDQKERESMDRTFQQGIETIDINVAFVAKNAASVTEYLKA